MSNISEVVQTSNTKKAALTLSKTALNHMSKQLKSHPEAIGVRLSLNKTGCSGLSYDFEFISEANNNDHKFNFDDVTIYIEHKSYPYLKGLEIDFVKEGLNQKYVYINPNQTGQCGCGESFTID